MNYKSKLILIISLINYVPIKCAIEYFDTTFGNTTGIVETSIGSSSRINGICSYANSQIIAAGYAVVNNVQNVAVARYSSTGILDASFGSNGVVTTLSGTSAIGNDVAIDSNGNIIVVGTTIINGINNLIVIRYLPNGSLDLNFGTGGKVTRLIGTSCIGNALAIDANNKILITGTAIISGKNNAYVARYNTNGTIDTNFGTSGVKSLVLNSGLTSNSIAIDQSARIVIGGSHMPNSSTTNFMLARLLPINGAADTTFDTDGIVSTSIAGATTSVVKSIFIDSSNQIVAGGYSGGSSNSNFTIAKYTTSGALNTTFGTSLNGIQITNIGTNSQIESIIKDLNGNLVAAGISDNKFVIARYFVNGSLDTSFGINGILLNSFGSNSQINSQFLQAADGKVVVGGNANDSGQSQFILARYNKNNVDFINVTSISNNSFVNSKIPPIAGTSSLANAQVQVFINGTLFNTVSTNNFGNWDAGIANILPLGLNNIVVKLLNNSNLVVAQSINFTVIDNFAEDTLFAYSTNPQYSTSSSYVAVPFHNIPKIGTWSYSNSSFTCNTPGIYLFQYSANAAVSGLVGSGTSSIDVATCVIVNNVEYLGSEGDCAIDLNQNFSRSLTRSFVKALSAGDIVQFNFAVNIVGDNTGFNAGLANSANAIGTQPCYSLTITRIG